MKSFCGRPSPQQQMVVRSFRDVREKRDQPDDRKYPESSSLPLNLIKLLSSLTNDVICRVALGKKYGCETDFKELTERFSRLFWVPLVWVLMSPGLRGLIGSVVWIVSLKRQEMILMSFLEKVFDDHVDGDRDGTDFVDVLLTIQRDKSVGFQLDRLSIKAIISDVFVGATDTSYTLMEWVMTELLRHRECLNKTSRRSPYDLDTGTDQCLGDRERSFDVGLDVEDFRPERH
ncbi:hypothetical protein HID58_052779 [Brassica napus]|uniref:Uncharacterized protein n=1 Tax=Brassica napus TaxID=3708 RepID=A0ABQ8AE76_BRANA|nr:hypothetical protein HID58_052779 [Brassica napus]